MSEQRTKTIKVESCFMCPYFVRPKRGYAGSGGCMDSWVWFGTGLDENFLWEGCRLEDSPSYLHGATNAQRAPVVDPVDEGDMRHMLNPISRRLNHCELALDNHRQKAARVKYRLSEVVRDRADYFGGGMPGKDVQKLHDDLIAIVEE